MDAGVFPVGVRYSILGSNWDRYQSNRCCLRKHLIATHEAAEVIFHDRVHMIR